MPEGNAVNGGNQADAVVVRLASGCMVRRDAANDPPSGGRRRRRAVMAKGQVRSNKETRKPKAEKPKPAVSVGSSPFTQPPGKK
ncbi:hypothetical protein GCM10009101_03380 [Brevundimonas lenta]